MKKIYYHGTDSEPFDVLDQARTHRSPEDGDAGYFGWGFYLTDDKDYAETFGDNVLEFSVELNNPFTFDLDDYSELIDFIFKQSEDSLPDRLEYTLYALKHIGLNKNLEFKNTNSVDINSRCLETYSKYNGKELGDDEIIDIKNLLSILAKKVSNWLNGLFMQFGEELYNYFTSKGYDGIIAQGGKEVVVYSPEQLTRITNESLDFEDDFEPVEKPQSLEEFDIIPVSEYRNLINLLDTPALKLYSRLLFDLRFTKSEIMSGRYKMFIGKRKSGTAVAGLIKATDTGHRLVPNMYRNISENLYNQIKELLNPNKIKEDLDFDDGEILPAGTMELQNKIKQILEGNEYVEKIEKIAKLNPERLKSVWFDNDEVLVSFIINPYVGKSYDNGYRIKVEFCVASDTVFIYDVTLNDNEWDVENARSVADLEAQDIYTDKDVTERAKEIGDKTNWDISAYEDNYSQFYYAIYGMFPDGSCPNGNITSADLDWECYDVIDVNDFKWVVDSLVDDFWEWTSVSELFPDEAQYAPEGQEEDDDEEEEEEPLTEDLDLEDGEVDNDEYEAEKSTKDFIDKLKQWSQVTDAKEGTLLYPKRLDAFWYCDSTLFTVDILGKLRMVFYCGGDPCVYFNNDGSDYANTAEDLEERGIYTDTELFDAVEDVNEPWVDNSTSIDFSYYKINPNGSTGEWLADSWEMGYDTWYDLSDVLRPEWIVANALEDLDDNKDEWFPDEDIKVYPDAEEEEEPQEPEPEEVADEIENTEEEPITEAESPKEIKKLSKEKLLKEIVKEFGLVSEKGITDAIYILPSGRILDTKGSYSNHQHENIAKYIFEKHNIKDATRDGGSKFMDSIGAIRMTPWIPSLVIPSGYITEKQENMLYNIIEEVKAKVTADHPFMISNLDGSQFLEIKKITNPEDVINSILGYQVIGILKENIKKDKSFLNHLKY